MPHSRELKAYMKEVSKYPILSKEDEIKYAKKAKTGDLDAQHKLVVSNLKFVVQIANQFRAYTDAGKYSLLDLIQEGNAGLMHAATKFDWEKDYRFITYAVWWIKAKMMNFIIKGHSVVKIGTTANERKLFFKKGEVSNLLSIRDPEERVRCREELASKLNTSIDLIAEMEQRLYWHDTSTELAINSATSTTTVSDLLADEVNLDHDICKRNLDKEIQCELEVAMQKLTERERDIIKMRYLDNGGATLQKIADKYSLSRERIRQIECTTLKKLKVSLLNSKKGKEILAEM